MDSVLEVSMKADKLKEILKHALGYLQKCFVIPL